MSVGYVCVRLVVCILCNEVCNAKADQQGCQQGPTGIRPGSRPGQPCTPNTTSSMHTGATRSPVRLTVKSRVIGSLSQRGVLGEVVEQQLSEPLGRGLKGRRGRTGRLGQAGSIGSTAAVQNAVVDALAHLGIRHLDMPLTPERIWQALAGS